MHFLLRVFLSFVVFCAVYFFSFWMVFAMILPDGMWALANVLALLTGIAASVGTYRAAGNASGGWLKDALLGSAILGGVGFCGGFFGPMIFAPDANQGPLLGLLITGPLGFVLGGLGGALWSALRGKLSSK